MDDGQVVDLMVLDGTKIGLYRDRVKDWVDGKMVAPVTVDMALTRACNMNCVFCYGKLQENARSTITPKVIKQTLRDFAEIGVKGVSLISDGESTCSPHLDYAISEGYEQGLAMALGTNGELLDQRLIMSILPKLSYLRFNISAGQEQRFNEIMRPSRKGAFDRVVSNIRHAVDYKEVWKLKTTIGMQMVLMPEFEDQIIPLSELAVRLGVDYLIIKHCSDDEAGSLGVDYTKYKKMYNTLKEAEKLSNNYTKIVVKWSKLADGNVRTYKQCYGPPFLLQISGSGLVAPCGMFFGEKYKDFHIGNITKNRFKDIWKSHKYWDVMNRLASPRFNAQTDCGCLCLQHSVCKALDKVKKTGVLPQWVGDVPLHKEFV